ncbi:MAG: hypothetical protein FJ390_04250 [Verrucomicrobia bacterium]|nr:hypothetical protein [Verrucomicrobiota bacterium]
MEPYGPTGIAVRTTVVSLSGVVPYGMSCFNPSLYEPYTFFTYPFPPFSYAPTTYLHSNLLGSNQVTSEDSTDKQQTTVFHIGGGLVPVYENYSTQILYFSQFSTFYSTYAASYQIDPVTFSIRFGTEFQNLYASTAYATNITNTYENLYTEQIYWYNIQTGFGDTKDTTYTILGSGLSTSFIYQSQLQTLQPGLTLVGSSTFVNMLGSNVYSALLDTTNSVIIYQNEQISSYYSQSLSYQINIINLTAALNSVSQGNPGNEGNGTITVTYFSWQWETSPNGWTGSQLTHFNNYTYEQTVNSYLYFTYGGTIIYGTDVAVNQVQALLSIQNNNLANSQTFLNNAVSTLQSQVSLAGQIITALASGMETLINNI